MSASVWPSDRPTDRPSVDAPTGQTARRILMKFGMCVLLQLRTASAEFRVDPTTVAPPSGNFVCFFVQLLCVAISTKGFDGSSWNFTGMFILMNGWHLQSFVTIWLLRCPLVAIFYRYFTFFLGVFLRACPSKCIEGSSWNFAHVFLSMNDDTRKVSLWSEYCSAT